MKRLVRDTKGKLLFVWPLIGLFMVVVVGLLLGFSSPTSAQTMNTINFQGKVVQDDGLNVSSSETSCISGGADTCGFQVVYYDASTGGNTLGTETFTNVEIGDYDGVVNLGLGTGSYSAGTESAFVDIFTNNSTTYAEVKFDHDGNATYTEVFGRMAVRSAAYAVRADTADSINGMDEGDFVQFAPSSVQTDTSTSSSIFINKTGASGNILQIQKSAGDVMVLDNSGDLTLANDVIINGLTVGRGGGGVEFNTALGTNAMSGNTTGMFSIGLGYGAAGATTTGDFVVAIGANALMSNKANNRATAIGTSSMMFADDRTTGRDTYNTAVGYQALMGGSVTPANNTGRWNTALGDSALLNLRSGDSNTGLGVDTLKSLNNGSENIAIGFQTGDNLATGSTNIIIGYNVDVQDAYGDDQMTIGNLIFATGGFGTEKTLGTGNVGIGDASPSAKFVVGNGDLFQVNSSGAIAAATGITSSGTITFSGLSTAGVTMHNASGVLSNATVATCSGDDKLQYNGTNFVCDTDEVDDADSSTTNEIQNLFATVSDGSNTATVDSSTDTLRFVAGSNITIIAGNDHGTYGDYVQIDGTNTTYSAGNDLDLSGTTFNIESTLNYVSTITRASSDLTLSTTTSGDINIQPAVDINLGPGGIVSLGADIIPDTDDTYDIGSSTYRIQDLYLGPTSLHIGEDGDEGVVSFSTASNRIETDQDLKINGVIAGKGGSSFTSNTIFGGEALVNTTGDNNTAIGYYSLNTNSGNTRSTAVGYMSLRYADNRVSGRNTYNTALGYYALYGSTTAANNTGQYNTAVGDSSLMDNTDGTSNTALGYVSLGNNTTGDWNVAVGNNSLSANTTGGSNVALGGSSASNTTTGSNNLAIGSEALVLNVGNSRSTAIGKQAMYYADNRVTGRDTYNTAIGYSALRGSTTAANNTGRFNVALGDSALISNTSGDANVAIGSEALRTNTTGGLNVAIGLNAMYANLSGEDNVAIGSEPLASNQTGNSNIAIGTSSMTNNVSGIGNIALGFASLFDNDGGDYNIAIGYESMAGNVDTSRSTAVGYQSLYYTDWVGTGSMYNTAIGYESMEGGAMITGQYNTAVGDRSLAGIGSGDSNIALGANAGDNISSGSSNIMIGYNIDAQGATSSNQLSIGNLIFATGGFGTGTTVGTGNVGIGDASPSAKFVVGNGDLFQVNSSGAIAAATGITSSGTITFSGLSTDGFVTVSSGVLGSQATLGLAEGGTGASLTDPDTDSIMFWDDSESTVDWMTPGNDLSFANTQIHIESTLNYVSTITRASSDLNLSTTTSGDIFVNSAGVIEMNTASTTDGYLFMGGGSTTGESDMFIVQDPDTGASGQDESSSFKVLKSGNINDASDGYSLVELSLSGTDYSDDDEAFFILGRLADEGAVEWGVSTSDSDIWTTGGLKAGATGTNCANTDAACFNTPAFTVTSAGVTYIGADASSASDLYIADRLIDWDSSSYYIDPNSTSSLNTLDLDGVLTTTSKIQVPENFTFSYGTDKDFNMAQMPLVEYGDELRWKSPVTIEKWNGSSWAAWTSPPDFDEVTDGKGNTYEEISSSDLDATTPQFRLTYYTDGCLDGYFLIQQGYAVDTFDVNVDISADEVIWNTYSAQTGNGGYQTVYNSSADACNRYYRVTFKITSWGSDNAFRLTGLQFRSARVAGQGGLLETELPIGWDFDRNITIYGGLYAGSTAGDADDLYLADRLVDWDDSSNYYLDPNGNNYMNFVEMDSARVTNITSCEMVTTDSDGDLQCVDGTGPLPTVTASDSSYGANDYCNPSFTSYCRGVPDNLIDGSDMSDLFPGAFDLYIEVDYHETVYVIDSTYVSINVGWDTGSYGSCGIRAYYSNNGTSWTAIHSGSYYAAPTTESSDWISFDIDTDFRYLRFGVGNHTGDSCGWFGVKEVRHTTGDWTGTRGYLGGSATIGSGNYAAADGTLYLGSNGTSYESLMWDDSDDQFELSDDLNVTGQVYASTGFLVPNGGNYYFGSANATSPHIAANGSTDVMYIGESDYATDNLTISMEGYVSFMDGHNDLAEYFISDTPLQKGELVSISDVKEHVIKTTEPVDQRVLGVVSTDPSLGIRTTDHPDSHPIALAGRVPVMVVGRNISVGDYLLSSPVDGIAMKAIVNGSSVGKAMQATSSWSSSCPFAINIDNIPWPHDKGNNTSNPCFRVPVSSFTQTEQGQIEEYDLDDGGYVYVGKVMMFISPEYYSKVVDSALYTSMLADYETGVLSGTLGDFTTTSITTESITGVTAAFTSLNVGSGFSVNSTGDLSVAGDISIGKYRFAVGEDSLELYGGGLKVGELVAGTITTDILRINRGSEEESASAGVGIIAPNDAFVLIETTSVEEGDLVFVTVLESEDDISHTLTVGEVIDGSFKVNIDQITDVDVSFNWWVVK